MKIKKDNIELEVTKEEIAFLLDKLEMFWIRMPDYERKQILSQMTVKLADSIELCLKLLYNEKLKEKEIMQ